METSSIQLKVSKTSMHMLLRFLEIIKAVHPLEKKISAGKILEIPKYRQISHKVTLDAGSVMISGKIPKSTKFERLFPFRLRKGSKQ